MGLEPVVETVVAVRDVSEGRNHIRLHALTPSPREGTLARLQHKSIHVRSGTLGSPNKQQHAASGVSVVGLPMTSWGNDEDEGVPHHGTDPTATAAAAALTGLNTFSLDEGSDRHQQQAGCSDRPLRHTATPPHSARADHASPLPQHLRRRRRSSSSSCSTGVGDCGGGAGTRRASIGDTPSPTGSSGAARSANGSSGPMAERAVGAAASYSSTCSSPFVCGAGGMNLSLSSGLSMSISAASGASSFNLTSGRSMLSASACYSLVGADSNCSTSSAWSGGLGPGAEFEYSEEDEACSTSGTSNSACSWILSRFGGREVLADYEFGVALGRGTFGVTRLVTERVSAQPFACKTVCKERINSRQYVEDMRSEVQILQHLVGVPGVVQLRGAYEDCRAVNLVLELCAGGDLLDHILRLGRLEEDAAAAAARAIVLALQRCHARGVMHRDVKPENFLLAAEGCAASCRASDFGVSAFFEPGQKFMEVVGTPYYMAPEVLLRCYDQSADIWSAGVVLFLMLSGQLPFMGPTDRHVCAAVLHGKIATEGGPWASVSEGAKEVVRRMLHRDPKRRATAEELLAHPWLAREPVVVAVAAAQATAVPPAVALAAAGKGAACAGGGKTAVSVVGQQAAPAPAARAAAPAAVAAAVA